MAEEYEQQPVAGADPTRAAPGLGPEAEDPAVTAAGATEARTGTEPGTGGGGPRATNAGRVWVSLAVATLLLVLLIIFIAENSRSVTISFLGANGHLSLALALLIAAVVGAAVTLLTGTARILQLRWEVRRTRRAGNAQGRHRLQAR